MTPCRCGYPDARFCPLHGAGLRAIIAVATEHGALAGEAFAEAFGGREAPCSGCVLGVGAHDTSACEGKPAADTPARRAFLAFMWRQPGEDAAEVRAWTLTGDARIRGWVESSVRALKNVVRLTRDEDEERRLLGELALLEAYLVELPRPRIEPDRSTPERRAFWEHVEQTAAEVAAKYPPAGATRREVEDWHRARLGLAPTATREDVIRALTVEKGR